MSRQGVNRLREWFITFRKVYNNFHDQVNKDIKSIKKSNNVFIFTDKTRNLYEISNENYNRLLTKNITKTYRKTTNKIYNKEVKAIANNYEIAERVDRLPMTDAFITLKDHKPNFTTNPKCSLINPQKQPSRDVLGERCSKNMQQICRRTPMLKCDFNKVAKQLY